MSTDRIRTFVAVEIPEAVKQRVEALEAELMRSRAHVTWVKPCNLHLTLRFLGEILPGRLDAVHAGVDEAVATAAPFRMTLGRPGAYPDLDRPRVFWLGVDEGREPLMNLQEGIERALRTRRFAREERPFSPHLTVGRVRSPKGLGELTARIGRTRFEAPPFGVDRIAIVRSELRPSGPVYTVLERAELRGV